MKNILLACLLVLCTWAGAQTNSASGPYYFRSLNIDNGLSNNSVNVVLQDRQGRMWFGTKDGLNLYNGISCRTFGRENSGLGNNFITALYETEDQRLWIGTDDGAYIYNPETERFSPLCGGVISFIGGDEDGHVWVACNGQGLQHYSPDGSPSTPQTMTCQGRALTANVSQLWQRDGVLWLAYYEDNLYLTAHPGTGECRPFVDKQGEQPFLGLELNCVAIDAKQNLTYVGTNRGLFVINHMDESVRHINDEYVRSCCLDGVGQLWVGTEDGLFIINPATFASQHIRAPYSNDAYALSDNAIYAIYCDHEDGIWIGSYFGGINYYSAQNSVFHKVYPSEQTPLMGKRVREICPGLPGQLWVGTEDRGLFVYDTATGQIQPYTHPQLYHNVHGLCRIGDELWVGTFSGGLSRINLHTGQLRHYERGEGAGCLSPSSVFSICHTQAGETLLGTIGGVYRYRAESDNFEHLEELVGQFVYYIMEDHLGNVWYATYNDGVYCRDSRSGQLRHYMPEAGNKQSIPYHKAVSLFEDSRQRIWVATLGGGCCLIDMRTGAIQRYDTSDGFPSNVVVRIVEDHQGTLWFTTNRGLVSMNGDGQQMRVYSVANGLLSDLFNYQSGYVDTDGTVYLGSNGGLVSFRPQSIRHGQVRPSLVLSDFYIFNERAQIGQGDAPLQRSISLCDEVELAVDQNTFSLRAAVLSFTSPHMNQVLYRLEGYETEWHTLIGTDLISYANLSYGNYKLHIKGRTYDGLETNERVIRLHIRPPFYLTIWAYIIYILLLLAVGFGTYRYFHGRTLRRHEKEMDRLRQENERLLYDSKIEFFTNVAHEIRTPLTLIKSPLENVLASPDVTEAMRDDLEVMHLNTERLLDLVNELLDFRKTEIKGFQMHFMRCDLVSLLRHIHTRFIPFATHEGLSFQLHVPEALEASVDSEAFTKMTSNLLTNAIKYSRSFVDIELVQTQGNVELRVTNDGDVVPLQMREEIFKSFTRYNDENSARKPGSGVGLTLARSLAELHDGTLCMDDDLTCNRFVLRLPLEHEEVSPASATVAEKIAVEEGSGSAEQSAYTLLVVEDNEEMRTFVRRQLVSYYRVLTASNGSEALEVLERESVHLIISDVMMPMMDGMELCHRVKSDLNTSHIPVILLTAKVGIQAKIEGLQQGADAYIEKPFSIEHLRAAVQNLLKSREMLRLTYRNSPLAQTSSVVVSKADEDFLNRLREVIVTNLKDSDFSVDQLASELAMSRSSLNRKIKALLDVSPNDYVRIERLKYAAELLQEGRYKINEVCYMAGFNTPSYFARCFQKQFGVLPNEYVKTP